MTRPRWRRVGRILALLCLGSAALPVIYIVAAYTLLFAIYAFYGLAGLVFVLLDGEWLGSLGDLGALAGLGFWISAALLLCAAAIRIVWGIVRFFAKAIRPTPEGGRAVHRPAIAVFRPWLRAALVPAICGVAWLVLPDVVDERPKTHLTIYLAPDIVRDGGVLEIVGIPMAEDAWRAISRGDNPAMLDPANPKASEVGPGDRHVGAIVGAAATAVELRYPDAGIYTFNILPLPGTEQAAGEALRTELASVGSASLMLDPETGGKLDWPSISTIAVLGPGRDTGWARTVRDGFANAFRDESVAIRHFEGVRTLSMNEAQVQRFATAR